MYMKIRRYDLTVYFFLNRVLIIIFIARFMFYRAFLEIFKHFVDALHAVSRIFVIDIVHL